MLMSVDDLMGIILGSTEGMALGYNLYLFLAYYFELCGLI